MRPELRLATIFPDAARAGAALRAAGLTVAVGESSAAVRERVIEARAHQRGRRAQGPWNGALTGPQLRRDAALDAQSQGLLEAAAERLRAIPAGRLGDPAEFGEACAYLCSAQASYITGQNFLIDGGAYPGTF